MDETPVVVNEAPEADNSFESNTVDSPNINVSVVNTPESQPETTEDNEWKTLLLSTLQTVQSEVSTLLMEVSQLSTSTHSLAAEVAEAAEAESEVEDALEVVPIATPEAEAEAEAEAFQEPAKRQKHWLWG